MVEVTMAAIQAGTYTQLTVAGQLKHHPIPVYPLQHRKQQQETQNIRNILPSNFTSPR